MGSRAGRNHTHQGGHLLKVLLQLSGVKHDGAMPGGCAGIQPPARNQSPSPHGGLAVRCDQLGKSRGDPAF